MLSRQSDQKRLNIPGDNFRDHDFVNWGHGFYGDDIRLFKEGSFPSILIVIWGPTDKNRVRTGNLRSSLRRSTSISFTAYTWRQINLAEFSSYF